MDKTHSPSSDDEMLDGGESSLEEETFEVVPTANSGLPQVKRTPLKLPTYRSSYQSLKKLRAIHYKIISMHLAGIKNGVIAGELGVTIQTVGKCLNSPLAQGIIAQWAGDTIQAAGTIKEQLEELGPLAVSSLEDILLNDPDSSRRLNASKTVLEYIQSKAAQRVESTRTIVTADLVKEMRARVAQVRPDNMISDADYEEVNDD